MQLSDAGQQVTTRPSPNATVAPGWINNAPASAPPTISDPDSINAIMAELLEFLTLTGQTASKTNVSQVMTGALMLFGCYGIDSGGTANEYIVTPALALPTLQDGQRVLMWTTRPNTGAATLALAPLSAQPIVYADGAGALVAGAIVAGMNELYWNAGLASFVTRTLPQDLGSSNSDGWAQLPGGLIVQWENLALDEQTQTTENFPIAFPHAAFASIAQLGYQIPSSGSGPVAWVGAQPISSTQFIVTCGGITPSPGEGVWFIHVGF